MKKYQLLAVLFLCVLLTGAAIFLFFLDEEQDEMPAVLSEVQAPAVTVRKLKKTTYQPEIRANGFVQAREIVAVHSEISGKITTVPPSTYAGSTVAQGALLFALDEREYRLNLQQVSAEYLEAEQDLVLEKGRQVIAKREWQILSKNNNVSGQGKNIALRKPQLIKQQAALSKIKTKHDQVLLSIERTKVTAPCNGIILEESVAMGQLITPDTSILRLACNDSWQIIARFSPGMMPANAGYPVQISVNGSRYDGQMKSILPGLDPKTRQPSALIEFSADKSALLNQYATMQLQGQPLNDVFLIDREALRANETVWLLDEENTLITQQVTILGKDERYVFARGLNDGDRLILSHLSNPLKGMLLRPIERPMEKTANADKEKTL
jgi:RND family efflux transporter MFP subunit